MKDSTISIEPDIMQLSKGKHMFNLLNSTPYPAPIRVTTS